MEMMPVYLTTHLISLRPGEARGRQSIFQNFFSLIKFQYDYFYWFSCLFIQRVFAECLLSAWHPAQGWGRGSGERGEDLACLTCVLNCAGISVTLWKKPNMYIDIHKMNYIYRPFLSHSYTYQTRFSV